ncbi:MAG: thymidine kinase [Pseudomonadota bacterium]
MHYNQGRFTGWIEVVCGPMFSGKTEELIRRLRLSRIAKQRVQIFKASLDDRYENDFIASHSKQKSECQTVNNPNEILDQLDDNTRVVGLDEAQFFNDEIVTVVQKLANRGLRVIVAGLDQDYLGNPFGPMPELLAIADSILKLKAVCMVCGGLATRSQRLTDEAGQVVVGSGERYEARCRACFDPTLKFEKDKPKVPVSKKPVKTKNSEVDDIRF